MYYRRRARRQRRATVPGWARSLIGALLHRGGGTVYRGTRRGGRRRRSGNFSPSGDPRPGYWAGGRFRAWRV